MYYGIKRKPPFAITSFKKGGWAYFQEIKVHVHCMIWLISRHRENIFRLADRERERQTDRHLDGQMDRHRNRRIYRQEVTFFFFSCSMPDRQSQGLRFFSVSRAMTLRRRMKSTLSNMCKQLQASIDKLEREEEREGGEDMREKMRSFLPACLKLASFPDYSHFEFLTLDHSQVLHVTFKILILKHI